MESPLLPASVADEGASVAAQEPIEKCNAVGCTRPTNEPTVTCYERDCVKKVHQSCFTKSVVLKYNVPKLQDPISGASIFVCGKTCYNKVQKVLVSTPSRLPWDKDGNGGTTDPKNSLRILLDWLLEEGNYNRFRGHDNHGTRKMTYGQILSSRMKEAGCRVERSAEAVVKKIQEIEGKFIRAHDWVNNTGQGVKERDGMETFEGLVRQRCKWYFELLPIMGDRSKARPRVTTEDLDEDSDVSVLSNDSVLDVSARPSVPTRTSPDGESSVPASEAGRRRKPGSASVGGSSTVSKKARGRATKSKGDGDESILERMVEGRALSKKNEYEETRRHNLKMEELEELKTRWQTKKEELEYKRTLMSTKRELESEGYSEDEILAMFPDLAPMYRIHGRSPC
mgnify:CR=1 FL=1